MPISDILCPDHHDTVMLERYRITTILVLAFSVCVGCSSFKSLVPERDKLQPPKDVAPPVDEEINSLTVDQKRINLLFAKATLAEMDGLHKQALKTYDEVIVLDDQNSIAHHRQAVIHAQQGNTDDADSSFERALELNDSDAVLHNDYGYFCYLQKDFKQATEHLNRAVSIAPDYAAAHNNLAMALACSGKSQEAQEHFRLAGCSPAQSLSNLAYARLMQRDFSQAKQYLNEALIVDPNQEQAKAALATLERIEAGGNSIAANKRAATKTSISSYSRDRY